MIDSMKEEFDNVVSISQLVQTSRPVTGVSSLNPNNSNLQPSLTNSNLLNFNTFSSSPTNPNPKFLKPLNHPTILIGAITSNSSSLFFSDASGTVACDILDFELTTLVKKIHVLAWNFIPPPSECAAGGFLEIISWQLCSANSSVPIDCEKSRYYIHGKLESVSPVSSVHCAFLVQISVCESKSCSGKDYIHTCRRKSVSIYLCESACCWQPALSKLVGNVVSFSGLKKKSALIGKEESRVMYITTEKAALNLSIARGPDFAFQKTEFINGMGFGMYSGKITGVYLEGMVVELDEKVILLLTDQELAIPLSVRVGATVSVSNVHFVKAKFTWTKHLVLGACCKTSICVKSFSPEDFGSYTVSQSQSRMRKFINSLPFSARLWVLLTVFCFAKKFSGLLPVKQIFGSKSREGWVQKYSSSCLPKAVVRSRHGVLTEYCNHESHGCGSKQNYCSLKLPVPLSNFLNHCEATWKKLMLEQNRDSDLMHGNKQYGFLSCEGKFNAQLIRRVLHSEDIGISLIGKLKISPSSGKLQLVDATGGINIVIPELSTWCSETIYEMNDFKIVLEGVPGDTDSLGTPLDESFLSTKSIFGTLHQAEESSLSIYIYCHLGDKTSRNRPICPGTDSNAISEEFGSGGYNLLYITHKFPMFRNTSTVYAEAIVLPLGLNFEKEVDMCQTMIATKGFVNDLRHMYGTPCLVTGKILEGHCAACSKSLLHCRLAKLYICSGDRHRSKKVLLEFDSDSFCMYKALKIGRHYITQNHDDLKSDKLIITRKTHLLSVLFSSNEGFPKVGQCFIDSFEEDSFEVKHPLLRFRIQLCSDRCVFLPCDELEFLRNKLKEVKGIVKPLVSIEEVNNMIIAPLQDSRMPEGNLISLRGFVDGLHDLSGDEDASNVCIHVQVENRTVKIYSSSSTNAYPTGFGPGITATFYRIHVKKRNRFVITATSFIVIDSVTLDCSQASASATMISQIIACSECRPVKFHCKVVALYALVLEKNTSGSSCFFDIPLAGFILDDGSSLCCCWTKSKTAATLLHLHVDGGKTFSSPITRDVSKILENRQRIFVKNSGSIFDSSDQELKFFDSSRKSISRSEKELLKLVILNSCSSTSWSVVGNTMDSNAMRHLGKQLTQLKMTMIPQVCNIWATEIVHSDPLKKARSIFKELLKSS